MGKRIEVIMFAMLLASGYCAAAQDSIALTASTPDSPSNGVLELNVKQIMATSQGRGRVSEAWTGGIEITVKNVSQRPVRLGEGPMTYELAVWDASGSPVPKTRYGQQIDQAQRNGPTRMPATASVELLPGQEYTCQLGLRTFFAIQPGQDYTVWLKRWDRSMALIDESGHRVALGELSRTLKGIGHPAAR